MNRPVHTTTKVKSICRAAVLLPSFLLILPSAPRAAQAVWTTILQEGKPIERQIGKEETHIFTIRAPARHVVSGVVDQRGVDVMVRVIDPHGALIAAIDSPNGDHGPEPWSFEAKKSGAWRLEVSPLPDSAQPGRYEVRIDEIITSFDNARRLAKHRYQSPRMLRLWQEYHADGVRAIKRFANDIAGHAPLIEPLAEDPHGDVLVTFVRRVPKHQWAEVGGGPAMPPVRLQRFQDTELMYLTCRCPREARFGYSFKLHENAESDAEQPTWEPDVWNSKRLTGGFGVESLVELPFAPSQPSLRRREGAPAGRLVEGSIHSQSLGEERKVAVYLPVLFNATAGPYPCLVLLDGEAYGHCQAPLIPAPLILDNLIAEKKLPPTLAVLVDDQGKRGRDLAMSEHFSDFLAKELMPWVRREYGASTDPAKVIIAGSSLGGLCAAYTAFHHSDVFRNVLSQSGSFWYAPEATEETSESRGFARQTGALIREVVASRLRPLRFWMEAGVLEYAEGLAENRRMRDVLLAKGYKVDYREFAGGHDYACWRGSLADGLQALAAGWAGAPPGLVPSDQSANATRGAALFHSPPSAPGEAAAP